MGGQKAGPDSAAAKKGKGKQPARARAAAGTAGAASPRRGGKVAAAGAPGAPVPERAARGWTAQTRIAFLEALADLGQVRAAARAAGVSPQSAYRMRRKSAAFAKAWQEAMDQALDALEETLFERAINGVEKPVYYGGRSCGSVRQYSDALAMFLLRARRPETYGRALPAEPSAAATAGPADPVTLIEARLKALRANEKAEGGPPDGGGAQGKL
ncbi:hypothetical protein [Pedomonas mirosovicensis]|uniref:hypothetical protein n=1 Tax=Pedomonas mirosovicensis TaxID=2908641 RepID=UPI002166FA7C|nr:hypothetical protein [Pedomonas mirosovicensis]MCH8684846.1 hypothetical protein [Pedomonas mirosovicensis]